MSEYGVRHGHLRANVPKRRLAYKLFIVAVIVVFLLSIADIIWLDEVLFWPVVAAYVVLFVWAVLLLFSRRRPAPGETWDITETILHCPHCDNDFLYGADHVEGGAGMSCPVCGTTSDLPGPDARTIHVDLPDTEPARTAYRCDHCDEHFVISTIGRPPRRVTFDQCPHCHTPSAVHEAEAPDHLERHGGAVPS